MAFEELTSRQATMWSSAPFENIAGLISDMHVALVERLAPKPGEHWLDLACGAGGEMWEVFRDNYGPSYTLWTSLDEEGRAELDAAMAAYFEQSRSANGAWNASTSSREVFAAARNAPGASSRATGSRDPRR